MSTQDSRIKIKRSTVAGVVPTIPASNDHTDGTWLATDIYKGELFFNQADGILYTLSNTGVVTVSNPSCICVKEASVDVTNAQILALNTTPIELIPAQGAGTVIEVLNWVVRIYDVVTPFATNTVLAITNPSGTADLGRDIADVILKSTVDRICAISTRTSPPVGDTQMIENEAVNLTVLTGDPTAGNGKMKVYVTYRVITL